MKFLAVFAILVAAADAKVAFKHGAQPATYSKNDGTVTKENSTGHGTSDFVGGGEKCPDPTVHVGGTGAAQACVAPAVDGAGGCARPFVLKGAAPFWELRTEHYELRKLTWDEMVSMSEDELRSFMKKHDVPYTVRIKVLDLHKSHGGDKVCVPAPPICDDPLVYNEGTNECVEPAPMFHNPILDDSWISPTLKAPAETGANKASHAHQPVQDDPQTGILTTARHNEEQDLWNWEVNKKHMATF